MVTAYNELCPYCGTDIDVAHDDPWVEDDLYEAQCPNCEKYFTYTMSVSVHFDLRKADCLNGGNHALKVYTYSFEGDVYYHIQCNSCGVTRNYFPRTSKSFISRRLKCEQE